MKRLNYLFLPLLICSIWVLCTGEIHAQDSKLSALMEQAKTAGIEQGSLTELLNRAQNKGIDNQQLSQILESALSMSDQNLPGQVAIDKALEGLSKGVPGERIVPALSRIEQGMRQASEVVDPWLDRSEVRDLVRRSGPSMSESSFRNEMIRATSKSYVQNIPPDHIRAIFNDIGSEQVLSGSNPADLITAINILPDLPTTANQPEISASFIIRALRGGFNSDRLQQLPSAMKMAQQRSQLPAASIVDGVAEQMRDGTPAKQVLQNLFNGNIGGGPPGNIPPGLERRPDRGNNNNNPGNNNRGGNNSPNG